MQRLSEHDRARADQELSNISQMLGLEDGVVLTRNAATAVLRDTRVHVKWGAKVNPHERALFDFISANGGDLSFRVPRVIASNEIAGIGEYLVTAEISGPTAQSKLVNQHGIAAVVSALLAISRDYAKILKKYLGAEHCTRNATRRDMIETAGRVAKWQLGAAESGVSWGAARKIVDHMLRVVLTRSQLVAAGHGDIHSKHVFLAEPGDTDQRPYVTDLNIVFRPEGTVIGDQIRAVSSMLAHATDITSTQAAIEHIAGVLAHHYDDFDLVYGLLAYRTLGILRDCRKDVGAGIDATTDLPLRTAAGREIIYDALIEIR